MADAVNRQKFEICEKNTREDQKNFVIKNAWSPKGILYEKTQERNKRRL
jgi:hypothetical protein